MRLTARDIAAYERGEKRLRYLANRRPILNPNGPTCLVPSAKRLTTVTGGKVVTVVIDPKDPDYL